MFHHEIALWWSLWRKAYQSAVTFDTVTLFMIHGGLLDVASNYFMLCHVPSTLICLLHCSLVQETALFLSWMQVLAPQWWYFSPCMENVHEVGWLIPSAFSLVEWDTVPKPCFLCWASLLVRGLIYSANFANSKQADLFDSFCCSFSSTELCVQLCL